MKYIKLFESFDSITFESGIVGNQVRYALIKIKI